MAKIFIISSARSGSHYLAELIAKSKDRNFNQFIQPEILRHPNLDSLKSTQDVIDLIERDYQDREIFTFLQEQLDEIPNFDLFQFANKYKNSKFILLNRANKLDQYVSLLLAEKERKFFKGDYQVKVGLGAMPFYRYANKNIEFYCKMMTKLEKSSAGFKQLNYEGRFMKTELESCFSYLGLDLSNVDFSDLYFTKQRKKPIAEYLYNPEALNAIKSIRFHL